MDVSEQDPKAIKKALTYKQNRKRFTIQMMVADRKRENKRAREDTKNLEESFKENYANPSVSKETEEKLDYYRNKINGKKRVAKERWNRFAGTGDSGGRGL